MRSRDHVPVAAVALALLLSSCGWFGGGDTTTSTTGGTTAAPTENLAQPQSLLQGDVAPPPGVEAQLGLTVTPLTNCPRLLDGPEAGSGGDFEIPPTALARLIFGHVLYERVAKEVEIDPALADRIAALTPEFRILEVPTTVDPIQTLGTIPLSSLTLVPRVIDPSIRVLPSITVDPSLFLLPGITFPPSASTTTINVAPPAAIPEIPQTDEVLLCGAGWSDNAFLRATVTDAEGNVVIDRFEQAGGDGSVAVSWAPGLEDLPGRYTVTLTDGNSPATTDVDVVAPIQSALDVLGVEIVEPGDVVTIGFVGFPPQSTVALHVFAINEFAGWRYTGTAGPIEINAVGSAVYELQTLDDDPTGVYCLLVDGTPQWTCRNVQFEVVR